MARLERLGGSVVFGQASLLALQLKILWGSWRSWDLPLWDGATHFAYARQVVRAFTFPPMEWCPLFAAYYSMFHAVAGGSHPFAIYYAHRVATIVLVTATLYGFLRFIVSVPYAWLTCVYFLAVAVTLTTNYVVHLFVLLPLLAAYRAAASTSVHANACVLGALILAGCVRPEQFLAVAVVLAVVASTVRWGADRTEPALARARPTSWVFLPLLALPLVVFLLRGVPSHVPVSHSWAAWAQSYAQGYQERHPEWAADFWLRYGEAVERSFGNATAVTDAAANNPSEMLAHIVWNVRLLPTELGALFATVRAAWFLLIIPIAGLVGVAMIVAARSTQRSYRQPLSMIRETEKRRLAVVVACTWLPVAVVALGIRPRAAYLIPILPGVLSLTSYGLAALSQRTAATGAVSAALPALFVVFLVTLPSPFNTPAPRPVIELIDLLRQVPIAGDYGLFGPSARGLCVYSAPDRCTGIEIARAPSAPADFMTLLDDRNVRLIVVDDQMRRSLSEAARTFVANLESGSGPADWKLFARSTGYRIYLRSSSQVAAGARSRDTALP